MPEPRHEFRRSWRGSNLPDHPAFVRRSRGWSGKGALRRMEPDGTGASYAGQDLRGARLKGAVLRLAVFREAAVEGADLTQADLAGADFRGARAGEADFGGAMPEGALFAWASSRPSRS